MSVLKDDGTFQSDAYAVTGRYFENMQFVSLDTLWIRADSDEIAIELFHKLALPRYREKFPGVFAQCEFELVKPIPDPHYCTPNDAEWDSVYTFKAEELAPCPTN